MVTFPRNLPESVSYKAWDNGKDKKTPTTGLGKELKSVEAAWAKFDSAPFIAMEDVTDPDQLKSAREKMTKADKAMATMTTALEKLAKFATEVAKDGKKSGKIPEKSLKLLALIAEQASAFALELSRFPGKAIEEAEGNIKNAGPLAEEFIQTANRRIKAVQERTKSFGQIENRVKTDLGKVGTLQKENKVKEAKEVLVDLMNAIAEHVKPATEAEKTVVELGKNLAKLDDTNRTKLKDLLVELRKAAKELQGKADKLTPPLTKLVGTIGAKGPVNIN